jgi:tetratricopeptide (TPR) repeat protein
MKTSDCFFNKIHSVDNLKCTLSKPVVLTMAIFLTFSAGLSTAVFADQKDPRLDALFSALKLSDTQETSRILESQIWTIWHIPPAGSESGYVLRDGIEAMSSGRVDDALEAFDKVTKLEPDFAEGWNKRATVFYMLGDLDRSVLDIQRTLVLEPRHFGALSGLGLINLAKGDKPAALKAFNAALEIHPHLPSKERIDALRKELAGEKL